MVVSFPERIFSVQDLRQKNSFEQMERAADGKLDWETGVAHICIASADHLWSTVYLEYVCYVVAVNDFRKKKMYCNFIDYRIKYKNRCSCILFF